MGRDKASLPFGKETLLARVIRNLAPAVSEVIVVAQAGQTLPDLDLAIEPGRLRIVRDPVPDQGPLAGLAVGLRAASAELIFATSCDMPFVKKPVIDRLVAMLDGHDACVPIDGEQVMTLCAVYRRDVVGYAEGLIDSGMLSLRDLVIGVKTKKVDAARLSDVDPDNLSFFSCDTPERYERALRIATHTV
jgi:molybdopterin-guanine dinucleotide biosynthesis protein A